VNGVLVQGSSNVEISKCSAYENSCEDSALGSGMRVETSDHVTIEKCRFADNCVYAIYLFDPTGTALTACTIEKNKVTSGREGISIQGADHVVIGNKVSNTEGIALFLDDESSNARFERNVVKNSELWALLVAGGTGHRFLKNKYVKTRSDGVEVDGDDITMERDKVIRSTDTGLEFRASNSTLRQVTVVGSGGHGIVVTGTGTLIEGCKVIRTRDDAFKARMPGGNKFRNNKAKKSRDLDLDDDTGGANTYDGNSFDPKRVSPEGLVF
jgi:parallel beta-helix repeat protein